MKYIGILVVVGVLLFTLHRISPSQPNCRRMNELAVNTRRENSSYTSEVGIKLSSSEQSPNVNVVATVILSAGRPGLVEFDFELKTHQMNSVNVTLLVIPNITLWQPENSVGQAMFSIKQVISFRSAQSQLFLVLRTRNDTLPPHIKEVLLDSHDLKTNKPGASKKNAACPAF
jgi:hypothetical protein